MSEPRLARGEPLDDQARAWIVRLASNRASDADRTAHAEWLALSAAHRAAWDDASRTWALLGALGGSAAEVEASVLRQDRRRRSSQRGVAVSIGCAALLSVSLWAYAPISAAAMLADEATSPGEQRRIRLEDGTRITLNGTTALDWSMKGGQREVRLIEGEAMFEVAHDSARPFVVRSGDARIEVTGTRFNVRAVGGRVSVALAEGGVDASTDGAGKIRLAPGETAFWSSGAMTTGAVPVGDIGSWRAGRLIYRSRPLAEVIGDLRLYRRGRIIVADEIAELQVTGVFDPRDPDQILRALGETLPIAVDHYGPVTLVSASD